jgi:hypothetical protein
MTNDLDIYLLSFLLLLYRKENFAEAEDLKIRSLVSTENERT